MQGIEFETDNESSRNTGEQKQPTMVRWLLKLGVKDSTTANYILLGIAACAVIIGVVVYMGIPGKSGIPTMTPEQMMVDVDTTIPRN